MRILKPTVYNLKKFLSFSSPTMAKIEQELCLTPGGRRRFFLSLAKKGIVSEAPEGEIPKISPEFPIDLFLRYVENMSMAGFSEQEKENLKKFGFISKLGEEAEKVTSLSAEDEKILNFLAQKGEASIRDIREEITLPQGALVRLRSWGYILPFEKGRKIRLNPHKYEVKNADCN